MNRAILFLSRFAISLWIVLVVAFLSLLVLNAPSVPRLAPFAGVSIKTPNSSIIHLPNRTFTCTETREQFQCQAKIQNRLLDLSLTKGGDDKYYFSNCRALYDKQSVGCRETGLTYAPIPSKTYEITGLRLSAQQLQAVNQEYWGINALMQLGELGLTLISMGISIVTGIGAASLAWFYPGKFSKAFTSLACGFGMYQFVWGLLGHMPYDIVTPYGFTPDRWDWVVNGGAIAAGLGTTLATALLLWGRLNRVTKILGVSSSSVGIFHLCWLPVSLNFGYLAALLAALFGLTETFLKNEHLLRWFCIGISTTLAIAAARLLWLHTNKSIKKFLCLGSGLGVLALATNFFLSILLSLGYAD